MAKNIISAVITRRPICVAILCAVDQAGNIGEDFDRRQKKMRQDAREKFLEAMQKGCLAFAFGRRKT